MTDDILYDEQALKSLQEKAVEARLSELPVSEFMTRQVVSVNKDFSIKACIEIFKNHRISGAPVLNKQRELIGIITEYDLLIQSATRDLNDRIDFRADYIFTAYPHTTLKEVLVTLYKKKIKRVPVIDETKQVKGVVARIDVLSRLLIESKERDALDV